MKVKKDFTCPRDLLLGEMKYFQDYLSADTEKWEDVDISVHCDIKIFDWLIRYVKRDKEEDLPELDAQNAVSILISSDFLKMDQLVQHCINYCHHNLSAIIASPCNMNCINDILVTRIASTFDQHQLEQVKDKKDKFKSKLFCKKIKDLFSETYSSVYSPNNASRLFRCVHCGKMLSSVVQERIRCTNSRTTLDNRGNIRYNHTRDPTCDITEVLLNLKTQGKTWRHVFWRLWSMVNFLECYICGCVFALCDFKSCLYHPENPITKSDTNEELQVYPCCDQVNILFESINTNTGCTYRKHVVNLSSINSPDRTDFDWLRSAEVYNELLSVADLVCDTKSQIIPKNSSYFNVDTMTKQDLDCISDQDSSEREDKGDKKRPSSQKNLVSKKRSFQTKNKQKKAPSEEDDTDLDEQGIVRVVIHQKESSLRNKRKTWNSELPFRLNQDVQRENDLKRMNELLKELRLQNKTHVQNAVETFEGGIYHRLESKLRNTLLQTQNLNTASTKKPTKEK
ncbi:SANT and BTB domain regulator of class switch recombination-like isoform X2 [Hydractinia symbiolongicarpus]|uniref:SANT and BTB domain regulator of class switch recombination-like isoform X2 n=1 Tax=Hydractinia symbiolongicarpus TaxID=13093 RepID=UPI00254A5F53|nr:SANT and BTB domain regulator of class switch recombination-like isoform X2 [Hydractinia symbiolongicarpus]